jgi:twinkle protein
MGRGQVNAIPAAHRFAERQRVPQEALQNYLTTEASSSVVSIAAFASGAADIMHGKGIDGDPLPWPKTHHQFRFREQEVTLWHGVNGHGKSAVTTQVALWLALQGIKSCIGSFEMHPDRTAHRMLLQAAGNKEPSEKFFASFFMAMCPRIWIYDKRGRVDPQYLFAAMRYCAIEKGIKHFFVDSLMKCVEKEDDYNGQKMFVGDCCEMAKELSIHVHLIHHTRKAEDEKKVPSKFDAKGSGAITDQVDNVLAVWRNKAKEAAKKEAPTGLEDEAPDFLLICDKQRNGGWEGKWALWGDLETWHFREQNRQPWTRGYEMPAYEVQAEPGSEG